VPEEFTEANVVHIVHQILSAGMYIYMYLSRFCQQIFCVCIYI